MLNFRTMLGNILRASFLAHLLLLVCDVGGAPVQRGSSLPPILENSPFGAQPIGTDPALIPGLEAARARAALRRLQGQSTFAGTNTFLPKMREVTSAPAGKGGSKSWWPWSGSGAASTDAEINELLHASPISQAGKDISTNPATVGRSYQAVKLPGEGMDALVVSRMMQQRKPFFVEGAKGRVWLLTLTGDFSAYRATRQQESIAVFVRDAIKSWPIPTVAVRNTGLQQQVTRAGRSAEANAPLWEQLSDAWFGKVRQGVKYIRPA